jgi:hypothetical protein
MMNNFQSFDITLVNDTNNSGNATMDVNDDQNNSLTFDNITPTAAPENVQLTTYNVNPCPISDIAANDVEPANSNTGSEFFQAEVVTCDYADVIIDSTGEHASEVVDNSAPATIVYAPVFSDSLVPSPLEITDSPVVTENLQCPVEVFQVETVFELVHPVETTEFFPSKANISFVTVPQHNAQSTECVIMSEPGVNDTK